MQPTTSQPAPQIDEATGHVNMAPLDTPVPGAQQTQAPTDPSQIDYSKYSLTATGQAKQANIKQFVAQSMKQGMGSDKIAAYLTSKGYLQAPAPAASTETAPVDQSLPGAIGATFNQGAQNVMSDIANGPKLAAAAGGGVQNGVAGILPSVAAGLDTAGHVAGDIAGTAGGLIGDVISPFLPDSVKSGLGDAAGKINDMVSKIPGMTPDIQKGLGDVFNTLTLKGGDTAVTKAAPVVAKGADAVSNALTKTAGAVDNTISKVGNTASSVKDSAASLIKGQTREQILATPESKVYKLPPEARKFYFDNAKAQIDKTSSDAETKVKTDLAAKTQAAQTEAEGLKTQLATQSRDQTLAARPKIISALGRQSATYRNLVDEEMAPHVNTPVDTKEISDFVDSKYADSPETASAIKTKLGVNKVSPSETESSLSTNMKPGELPTIEAGEPVAPPGSKTTIGQIYNKAKALRQTMGSSAIKGGRTFTPDEMMTDNAVSTLNSFLKDKGIDLKEANKFWSKYAPVRNQLITEAKPFNSAGTATKTFANTLSRVARGADVNNENFIGEVEKLTGSPLTKPLRDTVAKLDANEKGQIAAKIEAEAAQLKINMDDEKAKGALSNKKFDIERQARTRDLVKKALKWGVGLAGTGIVGDEIVKHL